MPQSFIGVHLEGSWSVRGLHLLAGILAVAVLTASGPLGSSLRAQSIAENLSLLQAQGPPLTFEVAAVRRSKPGSTNSSFNLELGTDRFSIVNTPLRDVVRFAFKATNNNQIIRLPTSVGDERFTVTAKIEELQAETLRKLPPNESTDKLRLMVQALLMDRFKLDYSIQNKKLPLLALMVAKGGSKLTEVPQSSLPQNSDLAAQIAPDAKLRPDIHYTFLHSDNGHLEAGAAPIHLFTDWLSAQEEAEGRIVVDETGLTGSYDFRLDWTPNTASEAASESSPSSLKASLNTALQEQLGLKLKATAGEVPVIVIKRMQAPEEN